MISTTCRLCLTSLRRSATGSRFQSTTTATATGTTASDIINRKTNFKQLDPDKLKYKEQRNHFKQRELNVDDSITTISNQNTNLISLDLEMHERSNNSKIIEIGISVYNPKYQKNSIFPHILNIHLITKEHQHLSNGSFVPDYKYKNITGSSIVMNNSQIKRTFKELINSLNAGNENENENTCIIGHNIIGDLIALSNLQKIEFPESWKIIDTQLLWDSLNFKKSKSSLGYVLDKLSIPNSYLHNAVNDSYYTLIVGLMLGSKDLRKGLLIADDNQDEVLEEEGEEENDLNNKLKFAPEEENDLNNKLKFAPSDLEISSKRNIGKRKKLVGNHFGLLNSQDPVSLISQKIKEAMM